MVCFMMNKWLYFFDTSPLFYMELRRQFRRTSGFFLRVVFPLALFCQLANQIHTIIGVKNGSFTVGVYADFAEQFVWAYCLLQYAVVIVLTPVFLVPFLHRELRNQSIEWLLISDLTPLEILRGKVHACMGPMQLVMMCGWPIPVWISHRLVSRLIKFHAWC